MLFKPVLAGFLWFSSSSKKTFAALLCQAEIEVQVYNLSSIDIVVGSGMASHFCSSGLEMEIPAHCVDHSIVRLASLIIS